MRAYIFDYDDTLVMTRKSKFEAIKELGKRYYNMTFNEKDIDVHWGKPFRVFFSELFKDINSDVDLIIERYLKVTKEFPMEAYPEALNSINKLLDNYLVGILTSANKSVVLPDLIALNFPVNDFFLIQTADDTRVHKPNPEVFLPILNFLNNKKIALDKITYVGDSLDDHNASINADLNFIGVARDPLKEEAFKKVGARYIKSLSEIG